MFAIGLQGVFSLTRWCWQIHTGFHRSRATQDTNHLCRRTCTGLSPPTVTFSKRVPLGLHKLMSVLQPRNTSVAVWANPLSLATTYGITIVFSSSGYLDVSVPRVCVFTPCLQHGRFPHSDICGSKVVCTSPQLFAAYHVLHRLLEPRHPPYALICFLSLLRSFSLLTSQLVNELSAFRLRGISPG